MKIAVTGGMGFVGSWFLRLLPTDIEAIVLTRSTDKKFFNANGRSFEVFSTDYSSRDLTRFLTNCDAVLHLAASRIAHAGSEVFISNILLDKKIFKFCSNSGIKNVVFCSTRGVYGANPNTPWKESMKPTPNTAYSIAKCQSEIEAENFNFTSGMSIKILRIAQVFGLGEYKSTMITTFLNRAYHKKPIEIFVSGKCLREYIYVKDLAQAILVALQESKKKGIYNLGSSEIQSIQKIANIINVKFQNPAPILKSPNVHLINETSIMDNSKFYKNFNWHPNWSFENAVTDIAHDLKNPKIADAYGFTNYQ